MARNKEIWITATALASVLASQADAQAAKGSKSGVVAAVQPPFQTVKDGRLVPINIGDAVFSDQEVKTGENGRAQIVMLDRSSITVGPNTELTIETYEYDRGKRRGRMALKAAKGLFRFVGGLISKRDPVQIRTTVGTIGIRGAVLIVEALPQGGYRLHYLYGDEVTFTDENGNINTLNRPGYTMTIDADGNVTIGPTQLDRLAYATKYLEGDALRRIKVGEITDIDPDLLDLAREDPSEALRRLQDETNTSDADFELTQELLELLGEEGAGTGGAM